MSLPGEGAVTRLGVMGGTFDPIHLGHLIVASEVRHALDLDRVLFVPAARPWQKSSYSNAEDRFLMTTLAAARHRRFGVSRLELDRQGPTYTADTMAALRDFYGPDVKLFFITGADAALNLASWVRLKELAKIAEIVVVVRPGYDASKLTAAEGWPALRHVEVPSIEISSTDLRARVQRGAPIDFLVPHEVATYIRAQGLYVGEEPVDAA